MELAAALHHSAGPVPNNAVRSQKTVSSWGARRPGVLEEPEPPQVDAVLSCRAAGGAPSSALPQLAADDALDSMALSFLRRKLMEEEAAKRRVEEAKKEAQEAADLELAKRDPWWAQHLADKKAKVERSGIPSSASSSSKRKRKKRSKRKLPQVLFWCADTTLWARVPLSLFFFWCAVFLSVDDRPKMLDIMAGTEQKNSYVLLMCKVGFPGDSAPHTVFPSLSSGSRCSASWPVWTRRTRMQLVGFSPRPLVSGSHLFAVLLGSTLDTCHVSLQRLLWEIAENVPFSAQCLVRQWLWEMTSLSVSYSAQCLVRQWLWEMTSWKWSYSAQCSVRHWIHGAASLRGHSTGAALGQGCHALIQRCITVEVPQLQFLFKVVNIPVGAQRQLPMVSLFRDH